MHKAAHCLGMSALISHPESKTIEEQIKIFASAGFDSFFLSCGVTDEFEKIPFWSKCAESAGIDFEAVHAPSALVDTVWTGDERAFTYERNLQKILNLCSEGNVRKLVLHIGSSPNIDVTERGLDFWKKAEEYAKRQGVRLCYENANTPILLEAVVSRADDFHGFCFDVGHQLCYTPEKDYIKLYGEKPKDGVND